MELRLTVIERARSVVVRVDGRLASGNLQELERAVGAVTGPTVIDLSNLISADDAGVTTLRTLVGRGARLVGATPYMALLLADESPPARPRTRPSRGGTFRGRG